MSYVDLTHPLSERTPVYPGDPQTMIKPQGRLDEDGYTDHYVCIGTHVGTHIDAPAHMIAGGKTLDQYGVERFVGRGMVIDARGRDTIDADLLNGVEIQKGDIVFFCTGLDTKYVGPAYFEHYPILTENLARALVAGKPSIIGVDACSPDTAPFPVHKILLSSDVLIIENLTNLDQLLGKPCTIYALPIQLQLDGAQARVIATIE